LPAHPDQVVEAEVERQRHVATVLGRQRREPVGRSRPFMLPASPANAPHQGAALIDAHHHGDERVHPGLGLGMPSSLDHPLALVRRQLLHAIAHLRFGHLADRPGGAGPVLVANVLREVVELAHQRSRPPGGPSSRRAIPGGSLQREGEPGRATVGRTRLSGQQACDRGRRRGDGGFVGSMLRLGRHDDPSQPTSVPLTPSDSAVGCALLGPNSTSRRRRRRGGPARSRHRMARS